MHVDAGWLAHKYATGTMPYVFATAHFAGVETWFFDDKNDLVQAHNDNGRPWSVKDASLP